MLAILAIGFVVGCASDSGSGSAATTTGTPAAGGTASKDGGTFKVALLTPGPVSDNGWSALAYTGLQEIKSQLGAEVANQEASGSKIKDAMRTYAQDHYNLVFGHGFEYNEFGVQVAKDFPDTVFVSSSGGKTAPNAGAFRFYLEQGCYLAGMMAAKMSKSGTVGSVAVQNYPSIVSTLKAFEAGARAANPAIKIIPTVYIGSETDVAKAKQATEQVLAQGADFVIHQANATASGVFQACKAKGAYAFGTNADQNSDPSGIVIASATIVAGPAFVDLAKQVKAKTYKGSVQLFGMDKGAIDFVINPALKDKVPADLQKMLTDAMANIKAGKLVVPKDEF
ncbi:putative lipoprotein [Fimbriimonas ginsengisoli Gsoil 348]|uniref:Putative lipoprotein n=1 Tax=Fimbriimonas ginsengisoli Gsoil 348 TaxID=661478 RepID=A0A068NWB8_FIMGI|nr:putative lipoprotein [Fimbriimonas ginsengisoli Gsoil 348]